MAEVILVVVTNVMVALEILPLNTVKRANQGSRASGELEVELGLPTFSGGGGGGASYGAGGAGDVSAAANTGGGGGGSMGTDSGATGNAGNGGSGVIVLRWYGNV